MVSKKGGVGKSTTAVNLSAALALSGQRVLLIDLDPQASSSLALGLGREDLSPSSADVLFQRLPVARAARPTQIPGLEIIPGSTDLAAADQRLAQLRTGDQQLRKSLESARRDYGFVIADCPPSLSLLPVNAIVAADAFICPTTPHFLAQEGIDNLLSATTRLAHRSRAAGRCLGLLLTMVDRKVRLMRENVDQLRGRFGDLVFQSEIRFSSKLAEAPAFGQSIFEYAGSSGAASDYRRLADEIQARCSVAVERVEDTRSAPRTTASSASRRSWVPGFQPAALDSSI